MAIICRLYSQNAFSIWIFIFLHEKIMVCWTSEIVLQSSLSLYVYKMYRFLSENVQHHLKIYYLHYHLMKLFLNKIIWHEDPVNILHCLEYALFIFLSWNCLEMRYLTWTKIYYHRDIFLLWVLFDNYYQCLITQMILFERKKENNIKVKAKSGRMTIISNQFLYLF